MISFRWVTLMGFIIAVSGCDALSEYRDIKYKLDNAERLLSELQAEHSELASSYEALREENSKLKALLAKRGNIRDLYSR